jgi:Protein of unknown function (DUF3103)
MSMKQFMFAVIAILALSAGASPASAALAAEKRELAHALALRDSTLRANLLPRLNREHLAVDLKQWLATSSPDVPFKNTVERTDYNIRVRKGVDRDVDGLLQLRLAHLSMLAKLQKGAEPLYAYEPDGDDRNWQVIEAFDRFGGVHYLDAHSMPDQPVLVVDIDAQKDMAAGMKVMRRSLSSLSGRAPPTLAAAPAAVSTPVTIVDRIRLNDDEEPWISGDAEVYAIVVGVDPSRDQPALDIVDMPYLDNDGTDYSPNQILIFWDRYRFAAADVILMEHDDNTNYQTLVSSLFNLASQILSTLGQPTIGTLVGLGSALIDSMPGSWFTNDDDYADSYYTLQKGTYYTNYPGARGNALVSLRPTEIAAQ